MDKIKATNTLGKQPPSKIILTGFVLKNATLSANNYLEEANLREFECKIATSFYLISKKNYRCPIEVILNLYICLINLLFF